MNKDLQKQFDCDIILYDDYDFLGGTEVEFSGVNEIILYTALTETKARLLQQGKYNKPIKAFEYSNLATTVNEQTEVLVKLSYNTQNMFDTLHPSAYRILDSIIKKAKVKKADVTDSQLVNHLLRTYTGVRIHSIDKSSKVYTNTECMFKSKGLRYILRPDSVKVLGTQAIQ